MPTDDLPRFMATFQPQVWVNDNAMDIDGAVVFDATMALLQLPLKVLQSFRPYSYESDELAADLPAMREHAGPFEVLHSPVADYFARCGVNLANLTEEQLQGLRARAGLPKQTVADLPRVRDTSACDVTRHL